MVAASLLASAEEVELEEDNREYKSFTGTIEYVEQKDEKLSFLVNIDNDKNNQMLVHMAEDTLLFDMTDTREDKRMHIVKGAEVEVFYKKHTPIALSLPPQMMTPFLVLAKNGDYFAKLDTFNQGLISSDKQLKLNIEDKNEAEGYKNSLLLVFYKESTRSLPGIAKPYRVFKLTSPNVKTKEAVFPIQMKDGQAIVELRKTFESLAFEVVWHGYDKPIEVKRDNKIAKLTLGSKSYVDFNSEDVELDYAPILIEGKTYVPVSFIRVVARMGLEIRGDTVVVKY